MRKLYSLMASVLATACVCTPLYSADWLTDGGSPQRTAWQKDEHILSPANVKNMQILWKLQLDNKPNQMHALFPPLIVDGLRTPSGVKQVAIVAGVSDNVYGIDVETGTVLWKR